MTKVPGLVLSCLFLLAGSSVPMLREAGAAPSFTTTLGDGSPPEPVVGPAGAGPDGGGDDSGLNSLFQNNEPCPSSDAAAGLRGPGFFVGRCSASRCSSDIGSSSCASSLAA